MSTAWEVHPGWQDEPVIELGEDYALADVIHRAHRPDGRWTALRYRLGIPLLAMLLFLTASAPAPAAPLTRVAQIPVTSEASLLVHARGAFVLQNNEGHNQLLAYDLGGGDRRWSTSVAEVASDATMRLAGNVIMVTMDAESSVGTHTEAFDESSGKRLWADDDSIFAILPDGDVLVESPVNLPGTDGQPVEATGWTFERIARRTGRIEWSAGIATACDPQLLTDPRTGAVTGFVTLCTDPIELDSIDLDTGRVGLRQPITLPSGTPPSVQGLAGYLPTGTQLPGLPKSAQLITIEDVSIVLHVGGPSAVVDGYRGSTLAPIWSGVGIQPWQRAVACATALCLTSIYGDVLVDPATGAITQGGPSGPAKVAGAAIVMSPRGSASRSVYARVQVVGDGSAAEVPPPSDGDAWVERLTAAGTGVQQTLGRIAGVGINACLTSGTYLACSTAFGRLTFWHVR